MRFCQPLLLFLVLLLSPALPAVAQSPETEKQAPDSFGDEPNTAKPKKIWTNEDINHSSTSNSDRSRIDAVGRSSRGSVSSTKGATILSPRNGSVIRPGDKLQVEVALDRDVSAAKGIVVISDIGFSNEIRKSPPYSFTFSIPEEDPLGGPPLLGFHTLTVSGMVGGDSINLASIEVDVEEPDMPLDLYPAGNFANQHEQGPSVLNVYYAGMDESVAVYGKFSNGRGLNVTESTYLTVLSGNPAIVRAYGHGVIASIGPGETSLVFTYGLDSQQKRLFVPVKVVTPAVGLAAKPAFIDFGDQQPGRESAPRLFTITNKSNGPIKINELTVSAFSIQPGSCSNTTLASGASCSITVTFAPANPGPVHDNLDISNDFGQFSIPLSGRGKTP